jgi:hypothetical protein
MGGLFDQVGNPKGYEVVASVMENADVHFRIETLLKKVSQDGDKCQVQEELHWIGYVGLEYLCIQCK